MGTAKRYSGEVRERAVRLVLEHREEHGCSRWVALEAVARMIGCAPQSLQRWMKRSEVDRGVRAGPIATERERLRELERENRELRRANEILRTASAFFAQAGLDRRRK